MKAIGAIIAGSLGLFFVMPIWLYLLYQILVRVNASELMMFLYWIYVPASIVVNIIGHMLRKADD